MKRDLEKTLERIKISSEVFFQYYKYNIFIIYHWDIFYITIIYRR